MNIRVALIILCTATLAILSGINCAPSAKQGTVPNNQSPVIVSFTANPAEIVKGSATTLTWETSGASNVDIDQKIGKVPAKGKVSVTPDSTTAYKMTASGNGGSAVKVLTINVIQPGSKANTTGTATVAGTKAASPSQYNSFCRDGLCTFYNGTLYTIDYPETWKVNTSLSPDLKTVGLSKNSYSDEIVIEVSDPIGPVPVRQVAEQYIKAIRSRYGSNFFLADSHEMEGVWDWFLEWTFSLGAPTEHVRVYYKSTPSHLYQLRAEATRPAFTVTGPFTEDHNKIINSFKVQK